MEERTEGENERAFRGWRACRAAMLIVAAGADEFPDRLPYRTCRYPAERAGGGYLCLHADSVDPASTAAAEGGLQAGGTRSFGWTATILLLPRRF